MIIAEANPRQEKRSGTPCRHRAAILLHKLGTVTIMPVEEDVKPNIHEPWYKNIDEPHPFSLKAVAYSPDQDCSSSFHAVACFPWSISSIQSLSNGEWDTAGRFGSWCEMIKKWGGVIVVGGIGKVRLVLTRKDKPFSTILTIATPEPTTKVTAVAWCLVVEADDFSPIVVFSAHSVLYFFNLEKGSFHGISRGHGGEIMAIAVHPLNPRILCTTSRDHTVRLYDLNLSVNSAFENPSWPGTNKPCMGGPAFGLRSNESEGEGLGRCVAVLAGGPSGGHQAAVLGAAFHPAFPLIATCGMDNSVKLWRLPPLDGRALRREDKPVFSSSHVHTSLVLSINWLSQDVLISNDGPTYIRKAINAETLDQLPGKIIIWRWLGFDRFFPAPDRAVWPKRIRGCASDYQESASFKIISQVQLPLPPKIIRISVFRSATHNPLILIPWEGCVKVISLAHFLLTLTMPPIPETEKQLQDAIKGVRRDLKLSELPFKCWDINNENGSTDHIEACTMAENGKLVIGVGSKESIRIWRA